MKKKEQYRRIKAAKSEWISSLRLDPLKVRSGKCTDRLINELMKKYRVWITDEYSHCCYGWRKTCWVDIYEGNTFFSDEDARCIAEGKMKSCRRLSRTSPVFHMCEKGSRVYILITYRHTSGKDFYITGITDPKTHERLSRMFRETRR